ncbi:uncharacterized protein LOC129752600 [Uranotaenia lowii]|uniref:uncharacterized protein LOC129752600 n=1 Tax=Uranotaenia lowii TaxID=190385 RepID=UPI002479E5DF|nr:uncharacterized protein LOC129752600 [Uranotaenia lowii]
MEGAVGGSDYTLTPCVTCGSASTKNEGMVCCNGCDGWFHYRCVGVTESIKKQKKWFCPAELCQQMFSKYLKKQESAAAARKVAVAKKTEASERLSAKSDRHSSSSDETKRKVDFNEQETRMNKLESDRLLEMERQDFEIKLKERQFAIERELRARERELEQKMLERVLEEKKADVNRLKNMRSTYQEQMDELDKELAELTVNAKGAFPSSSHCKKTSTPLLKGNIQPARTTTFSSKLSKHSNTKMDEMHNDDSSENTTDDTSTVSDSDSEFESIPDNHSLVSTIKPTKAQLANRNGFTRKFPQFSGKPEEWPLFISCFTSSTEACGYNHVENLVRLQESLNGQALENVRGHLLFPKLVPKVIKKLRQLYGRPEVLLQHYIEKVQKLQNPRADKLATYIPFGNAVEQLCEHIEAAGLSSHLINPMLIQNLVDKLPANDKREWVRYKRRKTSVTLRTLSKFLSTIVTEACEANADVESSENRLFLKSKGVERGALYSHSCEANTNHSQKPCKVCGRTDHRLRFCDDFSRLSIAQRFEIADKWKLCHVCLNDHGKLPCRFNKIRCNVGECRERHHPLLHPSNETVVVNTHFPKSSTQIMFRMIPVVLTFGCRTVRTIAFIDEGASVTLLEKSLAKKLSLKGEKEQLTINWTSNVSRIEKNSLRANIEISSASGDQLWLLQNVRTVKKLLLPKQTLDFNKLVEQYTYLNGLPVQPYEEARPGILIGLNNIDVIAPQETISGRIGDPIAARSKLGWTVYGPINRESSGEVSGYVNVHMKTTNEELYDLLKVQYALEEPVGTVQQYSNEDKRALHILEATTIRIGDRFETGLLWNTDEPHFPDSYAMALRRWKQLENQYVQKGYAHTITSDELSTEPHKTWYLPLNVVLHPKKPNKVRLVWDAAATVKGKSLNSQLLKGPDMLVSLPAVISKFRELRVAFGGDIREMYHQIRIRGQDKQAQRFLFRNNPSEPIQTFVMDVATFGATCSPCSAQHIKNHNAREFADRYPEASAAVIYNHYVDDYFDSTNTVEQAVQRATEVKYIHSKGGFEIRNWVSNSDEFLKKMGAAKSVQSIHFNHDKQTESDRVLGIKWDPREDVFSFSTAHREEMSKYFTGDERPTKRIVLSCVMGFFDPLGLLTPFTVHGKLLVQDLWRSGCGWDEKIDDEACTKWKRWIGLLSQVEETRISRCYLGNLHHDEVTSIEIHTFTDASEHAFGCAVYFRISWAGGVNCTLVMSRNKVAPLKRVSIPRLELMGALLGAKLVNVVRQNHSLK